MSKLYAKIVSDGNGAKPVTKPATQTQTVWVQTEKGRIEVILDANGTFEVSMRPVKGYEAVGPVTTLAAGNVNSQIVSGQDAEEPTNDTGAASYLW